MGEQETVGGNWIKIPEWLCEIHGPTQNLTIRVAVGSGDDAVMEGGDYCARCAIAWLNENIAKAIAK